MLVLADRGLYARSIWDAHQGQRMASVLAVHLGIKARAVREETLEWVSRWVPRPATSWKGRVECFAGKHTRVKVTLLLHWEAGYQSAWIVLTDLEPVEAQISWYGLRTWIETGFKDLGRPATTLLAQPGGFSQPPARIAITPTPRKA